ncbi:hypothetical protein BKA70DRAFT_1246627 [Coprinopsis sp. MPI-PUGE-AT-0042]|nr:hypothetical protein BKA70DRAFT_1246627 [Coprinopsis sp. MPI-PUGE-AT-0042]
MDAYMALFDSKPHLLRFICSLAIRFDKSKGLTPPAHFFSTVIPFFAGNLRDLRHILIFSQNAGLISFKAVGVGLPKAFSGLLPVDLVVLTLGCCVEKYLSTQGVANARPTTTCWVRSQDHILVLGVGNLSALTALLSRAAYLFSTTRLTLHHIGFALLPPGSRFAVMPQLEQLRIVFRFFSCPGRVPIIIVDYCTSFLRLRQLALHGHQVDCPSRKTAVSSSHPFFQPQPGPESGFARLDNLLADQDVLKELKNVTLNIGIAYNSLAWAKSSIAFHMESTLIRDPLGNVREF